MKIDSDQDGYAGIIISCTIALPDRTTTPTQRENWFLTTTPRPTAHSSTPTHSTTQPQVLRLPAM